MKSNVQFFCRTNLLKLEDLTYFAFSILLFNKYDRMIQFKYSRSSHCGSVVTNLTSIHEDMGLIPGLAQWIKNMWYRSSHCGSVVTNLTITQEDADSIPGLAKWVKDPMLQ